MHRYKNVYRYSIFGEASNRQISDFDSSGSQTLPLKHKLATYTLVPHRNSDQVNKIKTNLNILHDPEPSNRECDGSRANGSRVLTFDKENEQKLYSKLCTTITAKQKQRYLRKLHETVSNGQFKAVGFQFGVQCVKEICEYVITSRICKVILDRNPLGDRGVMQLSGLVGKMVIQELSLVSVGMTNKSAANLFRNLRDMPALRKLDVSSGDGTLKNKITSEGIQPLKYLLNGSECMLETLIMNGISLGSQGIKMAFEHVKSPPLQELSLSKNQIGFKYLSSFVVGISNIPLLKLDLSKNNLTDCGIIQISEILGQCYGKNILSMNLIELNLSSNSISSFGFETFCLQMGVNQTLQSLTLDGNPLGQGERFFSIKYFLNKNWGLKKLSLINIAIPEKDIKFLCDGVETNRSLQQLVLSKNEIDAQTLLAIFTMLSRNKSLRQLNLSNCRISDSHLLKNQVYLQAGNFINIQQINLQNNYINNRGADVLKRLIIKNKNILKLNLLRNCTGKKIITEIADILKDNQTKKPFQHQLNYFQSVSNLYEEKKKALVGEVEKMKNTEEQLKTALLVEEISLHQIKQEKIVQLINKENHAIGHLLSAPAIRTPILEQSQSQDSYFLTNPQLL